MSAALLALTFVQAYTLSPAHHGVARASQPPLMHHLPRSPLAVTMAQSDDAELVDRAFAAAVYLFPITDGFQFGLFLYKDVPPLGALAQAVYPAIAAFDSIPFSGLIFFIGLSALSRNPGLSRFLRFNLQQALLLDIAFIICGFAGSAGKMFPVVMQQTGSNTVFYFMLLSIGYAWYSIAQGKTPDQIPVISDASNQSIGPF